MYKKKISRRTNKRLNIYVDGGGYNTAVPNLNNLSSSTASLSQFNTVEGIAASPEFQKNASTAFNNIKTTGPSSAIGGISSGLGALGSVADVIQAGAKNAQIADTSEAENQALNNASYVSNAASTSDVLNEWQGLNRQKELSLKEVRGVSGLDQAANTLNAVSSGASAGTQVGGPIGGVTGGVIGLASGVAGSIAGRGKAKRQQRKVNDKIRDANARKEANILNTADNIETIMNLNTLANYSAEGGGIHIKKKNRGKFTASAKRAGMGVQEYARHILANKDKYSPTLVKRANFARNASKWHSFGGDIDTYINRRENIEADGNSFNTLNAPNSFAYGGDFSNGVTTFGNGGSHEENPYGGILQGFDSEGIPNLVEEGEVKYNNYIFSNRLFPSKNSLKDVNLNDKWSNHSFASIAEQISKESAERPNDPISKRGLVANLNRLRNAQEITRAENNSKKSSRRGNVFWGGGYTPLYKESPEDVVYIPESNKHLNSIGLDLNVENGNFLPNYLYRQPQDTQEAQIAPVTTVSKKAKTVVQPETTAPVVAPFKVTADIQQELDAHYKPSTYSFKDISDEDRLKMADIKPYDIPESEKDKIKNAYTGEDIPLSKATFLRYAPAVGSGVNVLTDALGLTNYPDYTNADYLMGNVQDVSFTPIGNYLTYRPLDRDYYINKLNAQSGATRQAILDASAGNRGAAMAGLLGANYSSQLGLGQLARQAEEYNIAQKQRVEDFNRATNMYNSQQQFQADAANAANRLRAASMAAQMRENADVMGSSGRASNINALLDSLGAIGTEELSRNMITGNPYFDYFIDRIGKTSYKKNSTKKSSKKQK